MVNHFKVVVYDSLISYVKFTHLDSSFRRMVCSVFFQLFAAMNQCVFRGWSQSTGSLSDWPVHGQHSTVLVHLEEIISTHVNNVLSQESSTENYLHM